MRDKIFISYSHKDNKFRERLETHLKAMTESASFWSDKKIEAGDEWEVQIRTAISEAAVAILFISADFLASDFIRNIELPALYKAADEDGMVIIPVFLYSCNCDVLMKYQFINTPKKPLGGINKFKQEEIFTLLSKVAVEKRNGYIEKAEQMQEILNVLKEESHIHKNIQKMYGYDENVSLLFDDFDCRVMDVSPAIDEIPKDVAHTKKSRRTQLKKKVKMEQQGDNSIQIGEISGGVTVFIKTNTLDEKRNKKQNDFELDAHFNKKSNSYTLRIKACEDDLEKRFAELFNDVPNVVNREQNPKNHIYPNTKPQED